MNYRSLSDLNDAIICGLWRLPPGIDLVVGVPRSGLLAANLAALALNVPLTDLDGFVEGRVLAAGRTRAVRGNAAAPHRVLVLDDSIDSGISMLKVRERIEAAGLAETCVFCAVYGMNDTHPEADIVLERVPRPRIFQWHLFHHPYLAHACVDIDGVLCRDPTAEENDDGPRYASFLRDTTPLHAASAPIGHLVTSRLERYRSETEAWLRAQGIVFGELHMLDLPTAAERRRHGAHASFKASVYRVTSTVLFIESEPAQAERIAREAGKPVLCTQTQTLYPAKPLTGAALTQHLRNVPLRLELARSPLLDHLQGFKAQVRTVLGPRMYERLKYTVKRNGATRDQSTRTGE